MKSFAVASVLAVGSLGADGVPIAVFHGLGDNCHNPGMHQFTKEIGEQTNAYSKCIKIGAAGGTLDSIFENFEKQAEKGCEQINADPNFQGEFNVVGLSQGSLLARNIVSRCQMKGKVRNWLSIGGPNMGVSDLPHCFSGFICSMVNKVVRNFVYMKLVQNIVGPAGYFRDPAHLDEYLSGSVFLPDENNERGTDEAKAAAKERFSALNGAMLVMFTEDSMVYPKESEWFQQLDKHDRKVQALEDSDFYSQDWLGLKALTEAKKVQQVSIDGDHLRFSADDVTNTFVPFLLS